MKVAVFPTAGSIPRLAEFTGYTPVAIDVLRATTTIIAALDAGAVAVVPTLEPEVALQGAAATPGARLGGERKNVRIPGFYFGNSPREYTPESVGGRTVFFTTTNGTRAIHAVAPLGPVLIAALCNAGAVSRRLLAQRSPVIILCAGSLDELCLEDSVCAGAIAYALGADAELNDFAWLARELYRQHRADLAGLLRQGRHGRRLVGLGFADDVELCAGIDTTGQVPVYADGAIRPS